MSKMNNEEEWENDSDTTILYWEENHERDEDDIQPHCSYSFEFTPLEDQEVEESENIDIDNLSHGEFVAMRRFLHGENFIFSREDLRCELIKISNATVQVDSLEVTRWIDNEYAAKKRMVRNAVARVGEEMNVDNVQDGRNRNVPLKPVNLPRELVDVELLSEEEANKVRFKADRKLNINKKPVRKAVTDCRLISQMRKRKNDGSFKCTKCGNAYRHIQSLNYHYRQKHLHLVRYQCAECPKKFLSRGNYNVHMRRHLDLRRFKCAACGKAYVSKGLLNHHKKISHKRRVMCPMCDQLLVNEEGLKEHMIVELANRKYSCHICGMKTKYYGSMYHHVAKCCV